MNREEALQDYKNKIQGYLNQGKHQLEEGYLSWEQDFQNQLEKELSCLCSMMEAPVKYFQISLLRSMMYQNTFEVMVSAHNEKYFLDTEMVKVTFDISRIFQMLEDLRVILYDMAKPYMGKIQAFDGDRLMMDMVMDFFKNKANDFRFFFRDFDQWECLIPVPKCSRLVLKWGEHRENSETIFLMDMEPKTQELFMENNHQNTIERWEPQYVYQSFDHTTIQDIVMQKKNFLFLGMRESTIRRSSWENSMFAGAGFRNTRMEQVVFAGCDLSRCDFRNASLYEVRFIHCKLLEADFRDVVLEGTSFECCDMEHALFSREKLAYAGLDAIQLQQIRIQEEPYVFYDGRR